MSNNRSRKCQPKQSLETPMGKHILILNHSVNSSNTKRFLSLPLLEAFTTSIVVHHDKILSTFFIIFHLFRFKKRNVIGTTETQLIPKSQWLLSDLECLENRRLRYPLTRNLLKLSCSPFTTSKPKSSRNPNHIWHVKFHRSRDFSGNQNHLKDKVCPEKEKITKRNWSLDKSVLWASRGWVMPRGKRLGPGNAAKPTWTTCYCGMVAECRQNPWDHGTFRSLPFPCLSCTPRDRSLLLVLPKRETPRLVMALRHHELSSNSIDIENILILLSK